MAKGELREGYVLNWNNYPEDEVKIKVSRPTLLSPTKEIKDKFDSGQITWSECRFLYLESISGKPEVIAKLKEIKEMLEDGTNVRLIGYRKKPECHREVLKDIILQDRTYILNKSVEDLISRIPKSKIFTFKNIVFKEIDKDLYKDGYRSFCLEEMCAYFHRVEYGRDRCKCKDKKGAYERCKSYKYTIDTIKGIVSKAGDKMWLEDTITQLQ